MAYGTPFSALTLAIVGVGVVGLAMLIGELVLRARRTALDPEDSPEAAGERAATRSAGWISPFVRLFTSLLNTYVYLLTRFVPFGGRFWRGLAKASLYNYYKRSGGDAIGLNAQPTRDRVDLEPVKYLDGLGDIDERPGWKAKGRENTWETAPTGDEVIRWGKTPLVLLAEEAPVAGSMLDAHVATAIDRGDMRELYHVDEGKLVAEVTVDEPTGGGTPGAVADGGTQVWRDFEPQSSPIFRDMIVEVQGDTALSWWNYKELLGEVTTSEQMQLQETRGFLAGLRPGKHKSFIIKVLLIAAGLAALGFLGPHIPQIIDALFGGGGGGGGGSVIPFWIGMGVA